MLHRRTMSRSPTRAAKLWTIVCLLLAAASIVLVGDTSFPHLHVDSLCQPDFAPDCQVIDTGLRRKASRIRLQYTRECIRDGYVPKSGRDGV
jgi:hypothetical protein